MAELENNEFEDFLKKLEDLNCPFIHDVDRNGIQEMFFKPGDSRIKIFRWLLSSFDSKAFAKFQSFSESDDKTSISKYLQKVFYNLGYCEEEFMTVFQGTASAKLQIACFNSFLGALIYNRNTSNETCVEINNCLPPDVTIVHSKCNNSKDITRSIFQYSAFLDSILEHQILPNFSEEFPLDIQGFLEKVFLPKKGSKTVVNSRICKDFYALNKSLKMDIEDMNVQIDIINTDLKSIPITKYPPEETNIKLRDTCYRISRNSSLYSEIHAHEIKPSCRPQKAELSELGPACSSLSKSIEGLNNIKEAISQFKALFERMQKHRQSIEKLMENRGSFENPDGWIHDGRVFRTDFIRALKPLVSFLNTQYSMMDTL